MTRRSARTVITVASPTSATGRFRGIRRRLLRWFVSNRRAFFWREAAVAPFALLVTEILLTKTRAELAAPVATEVLKRFPTPAALARAEPRALARTLYSLGLHEKRAEGLVSCARTLLDSHGGNVPDNAAALERLPYVGRYAANAVASVAFGHRVGIVDSNVARVFGRVFALPPPPKRLSTAHAWWRLADSLVPRDHAKEFNWALLDLGSAVCTPRNPKCVSCPLATNCDYVRATVKPELPAKQVRIARKRSRRAT
ncbi:MAG: A/G-specific adenine glycosylase [Kofleriaceae bacterium]